MAKSGIDFPKRGDIYWVNLDPTIGSEINKTRPCLIVSNNDNNELSNRVIIAPITSAVHKIYPFEVQIELEGKPRKILLDQLRCVDKVRLQKRIFTLTLKIIQQVDEAIKISLGLI